MKNFTALLATLVFTTGSSIAAADYRTEIQGDWTSIETEYDGIGLHDGEADIFSGSVEVFLQPVKQNKGPLAEQAFIERSSSISFAVAGGDSEDEDKDEFEMEAYGVGGRFVSRELGLIFGLGYAESETEEERTNETTELEAAALELGYYVLPTTTISLDILQITASETGAADEDYDYYGITIRHLDRLQGNGGDLAVWFSGGEISEDTSGPTNDVRTYELGATWYPMVNLGIGASVVQVDSDNGNSGDAEGWSIFAEYFVTETVSLALEFGQGEPESGDSDTTAFSLSGRVRL